MQVDARLNRPSHGSTTNRSTRTRDAYVRRGYDLGLRVGKGKGLTEVQCKALGTQRSMRDYE